MTRLDLCFESCAQERAVMPKIYFKHPLDPSTALSVESKGWAEEPRGGLPPAQDKAVKAAKKLGARDMRNDGDQRPLPLTHPLRSAWATGLNLLAIMGDDAPWFHRSCWEGDAVDAKSSLQELACDDVGVSPVDPEKRAAYGRVVETRFSLMRFSALHYAVVGIRTFETSEEGEDNGNGLGVVRDLAISGAYVDARDVAGHTALALAAATTSFPQTQSIIEFLVGCGADVDARNRFGEPLMLASIKNGAIDVLELLLRSGADPEIGTELVRPMSNAIWHVAQIIRVLKEKQEHDRKTSLHSCARCSLQQCAKKCNGCKSVYYCSVDCQKAHWMAPDGHKDVCKALQAQSISIDIDACEMKTCTTPIDPAKTSRHGALPLAMRPADVAFKVKIKSITLLARDTVSLSIDTSCPGGRVMLRPECLEAIALLALVQRSGIRGKKLYATAKWLAASNGNRPNVLSVSLDVDTTERHW